MALVVIRPGLLTTIQDGGRVGYRRFGVPEGGPFDRGSFDLANALLGNPPGTAALELTLLGGSYRAEVDLAVALAGAPLSATVEARSGHQQTWRVPRTGNLRAGETLHLGGSPTLARCYLAVRGGWRTPVVLGSRSAEVPLRAGDRLAAQAGSTSTRWPSPALGEFGLVWDQATPIRWVVDAEARADPSQLDGSYQVLDSSNRVGVRLSGPPLVVPGDPARLSEPVVAGTIQVAGGQPIILGVAGGTIGGYPVLGHVASVDLDHVGQLRPGTTVTFARIELAEARHLDAEARRHRQLRRNQLTIWRDV